MPFFEFTPPTPEQVAQALEDSRNATHPASWVWSEGAWVSPVAQPTDGLPYLWDEDAGNWMPFPDYPRG